jgi:hypothetical protein
MTASEIGDWYRAEMAKQITLAICRRRDELAEAAARNSSGSCPL